MDKRVARALPGKSSLETYFSYNRETGMLSWKNPTKPSIKPGAAAGYDFQGYRRVTLMGTAYLCHRIIWKMHYGTEPDIIDHINRDRSDNRIENLRSVSVSINNYNVAARNSTGLKGVKVKGRRYEARTMRGGKYVYIGTYDTAEDANRAYLSFNMEVLP